MNLQGKITLAYLEEDKPQGGLFRVRPLLNDAAVFTGSLTDIFPDAGYLRVVPDKNEQHTFKNRMREIAPLCVIDAADTKGKIRKNRNYRPDKQEDNQYVVYSDIVKPYPVDEFYQVVQKSDAEKALTEKIYIRDGANIQGPYFKNCETAREKTEKLPPDTHLLKTVELPEGKSILLYWAHTEAEAAEEPAAVPSDMSAQDQIQSLNEQLTVTSNPLKAEPAPVQPQAPVPVGKGTRLFPADLAIGGKKKVANPLAKAVEAQRKGTADTAGTDLPVPPTPPAQERQEAVLRDRLQELEAERLRLIMTLDEARKDLKAFTARQLREADRESRRELDTLNRIIEEKQKNIEKLTSAQSELLKSFPPDVPPAGQCPEEIDLIRSTMDAFHASGFPMNRTQAAGILAVIAQAGGVFSVALRTLSDYSVFETALADAIHTPIRYTAMPGGDSPDLRLWMPGQNPWASDSSISVIPAPDYQLDPDLIRCYNLRPWMFIPLPKAAGIVKAELPGDCPAPSRVWLAHCFGAKTVSLDIQDALEPFRDYLPAAILRLCADFISAVEPYAEGPLSAVTDLALAVCAVPYIRINGLDRAPFGTLFGKMPFAAGLIEK